MSTLTWTRCFRSPLRIKALLQSCHRRERKRKDLSTRQLALTVKVRFLHYDRARKCNWGILSHPHLHSRQRAIGRLLHRQIGQTRVAGSIRLPIRSSSSIITKRCYVRIFDAGEARGDEYVAEDVTLDTMTSGRRAKCVRIAA